jgi:outer membrane PBP1 activator LpoA protein
MQNLMTRKLINSILTICLLFGSLYLSAHATEAAIVQNSASQSIEKKTPEAYFKDGVQCLEQSNPVCTNYALANISSLSPYAKLLQGAIKLSHNQIDDAIRLLLPLQAEKKLISEASVFLHQQLARAFQSLEDISQAIKHLIQAMDTAATSSQSGLQTSTEAIQQTIWSLLTQQNKDQLVAMRGDSTDNDLQGWIDLTLASRNQDATASIERWLANYPDHSATAFAQTLANQSHLEPLKFKLPTSATIALILPLADESNIDKAEAFKQGLLSTLSMHEMLNEVKVYAISGAPEEIAEQYALAKAEGAAYFVAVNFNPTENKTELIPSETHPDILHLDLLLSDEAKRITAFAMHHSIQRIVLITSENETAKQMAASFASAWQPDTDATQQNDQLHTITLPDSLHAGDASLIALKDKISAYRHDMLLLALPIEQAVIVKPHLSISTPTMVFSATHESPISSLNAVRFMDIPFLLHPENDLFRTYQNANPYQQSYALSRWFALGADSPQLLTALHNKGHESIINGLTGTLTIDQSGRINRELSVARFTFDGIEVEK